MTALFHHVHWSSEQRQDRPNGIDFGEVLYADDTTLIGKANKEAEKVSHKMEQLFKKFRLSLNKDKYVHLRINKNNRVQLRNKMKMFTEDDTTYLGPQLHEKCNITKDLTEKSAQQRQLGEN